MKTRTKIVIGGVAAVALGAAALAHAGHGHWSKHGFGGPMGRYILESLDSDGDGAVTQAEVDAVRTERFARHDADGDGSLSLDEFAGLYAEATRGMMVRMFQKMDPDGDAHISTREYERPFAGLVERLDRNDDGVLSPADRKHRRHHEYDDDEDHDES